MNIIYEILISELRKNFEYLLEKIATSDLAGLNKTEVTSND